MFIFSLLARIYCYTFSNIFPLSLPLYLPTTLYFTITLLLSFCLFYILTLFLNFYFIFYKFNIISLIQSIFFWQTNCEYSLSLSPLSFGGFLFFLITLLKIDEVFFFFFLMCFGICFFNFSSQSLLSPFYCFGWILVWVNI